MKTLYLDCGMGAAGDMLAAALIGLLPDKDAFIRRFNAIGIPGVSVRLEKSVKCGICGSHFAVSCSGVEEGEELHSHAHRHGSLGSLEDIVDGLKISAKLKDDIMSVYYLLAKAESEVHGCKMEHIHFHEVGTMDALADISAVCMLMDEIKPEQVIATPVNVGSGTVRCAHGILPVPAPATALLLKDVPIYSGDISCELCTPTGAVLLKYFVNEFAPLPAMRLKATGYGMGKKDFPRANCLRAMLGETEDKNELICQLSCNVDDMTGEAIGFALERFIACGALDAFTVPIGMKKSRPGTLISVLCREDRRDEFVRLMFRHTSTLGVRETLHKRYTLERSFDSVDTPYGPVRRKISRGFGLERVKPEYADLAELALRHDVSIEEILKTIER